MMVNKFGESRQGKRGPAGPAGPTGPTGPKGEGMSAAFFRKQLAEWFYANLSFSCYFSTPTSGLVYKEKDPIAIKNQVGKNHALCLGKVGPVINIPTCGYGLEFKNSVYEVRDLDWCTGDPSKAIFIFAFKMNEWPNDFQYLFHTKNDDRGIYLKGSKMFIQSSKTTTLSIKYKVRQWNMCYIEFNNFEETPSYYEINDQVGTFVTKTEAASDEILFIGGKKDSYYFKGTLYRFNFYIQSPYDDSENLSDTVRTSFRRQYYHLPFE